ncbi:HEAT repeat domain-containing protein [Spirillospora sp. NPDC029432]|uniref:HEAT repeat domain-containing protein n=1 Tax=Spirillospora sp. NPDC029432 TaxID=3154599 RepID=UPI003457262D
MDPVEGLDDIDWAGLRHAYGSAEGIPAALRALRSPSSDERREARDDHLWNCIWHQGTRYPASAAAVPFLVALAVDPATPDRKEIVVLLTMLSVGYPDHMLPHGVDIAAWRTDLRERRAMSPEDWERRLDAWVQEAPNDFQRERRTWLRKDRDPEVELRNLETELAVYDAVLAGVPALRPLLESPDSGLRTWTAALLGLFPEEAAASIPALSARLETETDPYTLSNVITALGALGHRPAIPRIRAFLSDDRRVHRLAAATALVGLGEVDETVIGQLTVSSVWANLGHTEDSYRALVTSGSPEAATRFLLRAEADPAVFDRAVDRLRHGPMTQTRLMVGAALTFAFGLLDLGDSLIYTSAPFLTGIRTPYDEEERRSGEELEPFEDLDDRQRQAVRALADLPPDAWNDAVIETMLRAWGVPGDPASLQRYLAPTG